MATKIIGWKGKQVFQDLSDAAIAGANIVMDKHVEGAKALCPVGTITRTGTGFKLRDVLFTPKKGRSKGKTVNFIANAWQDRQPGSLKATIRKVTRDDRPTNVRVYAGNQKIYYARFTEYGTASTGWGKGVPRQSFMRPSFQVVKHKAKDIIEAEMRKVSEVKQV